MSKIFPHRVAVTAVGFVCSIGNDAQTVDASLRELRNGIEVYPPFDKPEIPIKLAGTIKDFKTDSTDPEDWTFPARYKIRREVLRGFSPHVLYAYCATLQAIENAKLTPEQVSNPDTGMYTASAGSVYFLHNQISRMYAMGVNRCSPMGIVSSVTGTLSYNLVAAFKIQGASCGFASACASSAHAAGMAWDAIASGRQKRMFVVGGEDGNTDSILPFAGMRALSSNPDPATGSRPFDKKRDGFVGTGGAAVVVLEEWESAKERGAPILAEFLGWGQASDGYNVAISHPEGAGLARAMENALKETGLTPEQIDYINAHGTSTPIGDHSEILAVKKVFGVNPKVAVGSTKAITGHGLSLAGAMEAGFCALAIHNGYTPGTAHTSELDPVAEGLNIPLQTLPVGPTIAMSNSSGFGGANVSLIFAKPGV